MSAACATRYFTVRTEWSWRRGDPPAFADALRVLLRDPDLRRTMGAAGAQRARDEFHAATVVGSLERLYERLLAGAGHSR